MARRDRVLLLEDDPQIRRFVSLVLSQLDVELVECAGVADALRALEHAPVDAAICDLMLAGESGFDLIERIVGNAAWNSARVVVFSAAIDTEDRNRMAALGVWGQLPKPTSVSALMRCVQDALAARPPDGEGSIAGADARADTGLSLPTAADEDAAVARFFEGDMALFRAYRESCRPQFLRDLAQGDQASASADLAGLRRLAHSLKTVVASLGGGALALGFAEIEASARGGHLDEARAQWAAVRGPLQQLADPDRVRQD